MRIFTHANAVESPIMLCRGEPENGLIVFDYLSALARVKRRFDEVIYVGLDGHWYPTLCTALFHL